MMEQKSSLDQTSLESFFFSREVTYSLESTAGGIFSKLALVMFQSTHSLRSATMTATEVVARQKVSIHALLAECDFIDQYGVLDFKEFQSTHS